MKKNGIAVIIIALVVVLFIININAIMYEYKYIETRSEQGNDRWHEVENRLVDMEEKINILEERFENNGRNGQSSC